MPLDQSVDYAKGAKDQSVKLSEEFQGTGVYNFAAAEGFSSQVFFCPGGNTQTSVGAAIAMRMGDTTVSIVRHPGTAGDPNGGKKQYAVLPSDQDGYYNLTVRDGDGATIEKVQVSSLSKDFKKYLSGNTVWMQETAISSWHPQANAANWGGTSQAAICVGNNPMTAVVDVSVPHFQDHVNWNIFYEMAVTVTVDSAKMYDSGICGIQDFLTSDNFDSARPSAGVDLLFSEPELNQLQNLCGVSWTGNGAQSITAEKLCEDMNNDYGKVQSDCHANFGADTMWSRACEIEECAGATPEWMKVMVASEQEDDQHVTGSVTELDFGSYEDDQPATESVTEMDFGSY